MKYSKWLKLYHVTVSHEFGGVDIISVFGKERAEKKALELETGSCGEIIEVTRAYTGNQIERII